LRDAGHHIEVGAVPLKTKHGWLFIHSYAKDYFTPNIKFGIEAALLSTDNPQNIIARTPEPLLVPGNE